MFSRFSKVASLLALSCVAVFACPSAVSAATPIHADCQLFRIGTPVVLYGGGDGTHVLVWDSRLHLFTYGQPATKLPQLALMHALFVPPGTPAVVTYCTPYVPAHALRPIYDVVNVIIGNGIKRGDAGWVPSTHIAAIGPGSR